MDLSARGMQKLDPSFTCSEDTHTLLLDRNHIMKLDHLERSPGLQQVVKPFDPFARFSLPSLQSLLNTVHFLDLMPFDKSLSFPP